MIAAVHRLSTFCRISRGTPFVALTKWGAPLQFICRCTGRTAQVSGDCSVGEALTFEMVDCTLCFLLKVRALLVVERHAKRKFSLSRGTGVKLADTNGFTDFLT